MAGDEREGPTRRRTLLDWVDPRKRKNLITEGREYTEFEGGKISMRENSRRLRIIAAETERFAKEDEERAKIKTIKDPEGDKSESRRKAAKRKQKGRAGTLLSQNRETLG